MWCVAGTAAVLYISLDALNGSLSSTGALCELDATPSISVDIAFTERSVFALCSKPIDTQYFYSIFLCKHEGYHMFIQYLS